jgi:hypothetical protein
VTYAFAIKRASRGSIEAHSNYRCDRNFSRIKLGMRLRYPSRLVAWLYLYSMKEIKMLANAGLSTATPSVRLLVVADGHARWDCDGSGGGEPGGIGLKLSDALADVEAEWIGQIRLLFDGGKPGVGDCTSDCRGLWVGCERQECFDGSDVDGAFDDAVEGEALASVVGLGGDGGECVVDDLIQTWVIDVTSVIFNEPTGTLGVEEEGQG